MCIKKTSILYFESSNNLQWWAYKVPQDQFRDPTQVDDI